MSDTTNLILPYLAPGQAQKHVTVNESLRRLDAVVQLAVASMTTTAEPGSPADGSVWIVPAGKSGTHWAPFANWSLGYYRDGAWEQLNPREGWLAWVRDDDKFVYFDGTDWEDLPAGEGGGGGGGAVADGDHGDITVDDDGETWTIDAGAVTTSKLANDAVDFTKLLDAASAGFIGATASGAYSHRTPTQATAALDAVTGDSGSGGTKGLVPAPGSGDAAAKKFLSASGAFAVVDKVAANTVVTASIADDAVDFSKLLDATSAGFIGATASGAYSHRTPSQVTAALDAVAGDSGSGGTKGLVPAPASGDAAANKFLKASGAWASVTEAIVVAVGDETTAITTGTGKLTFRMPFGLKLTAVRASLTTAQSSGSIFTVDINEGGTSVISTKLTIDNTEKSSTTAATAAVISDDTLADDAEITIDVDQVGNGTAKGLKVMLIGYRL